MKLTDLQRDYIINNFFDDSLYPGAISIGNKLLLSGECVVAGEKCIWEGEISNFIKTEKAEGFFGCLLYKFDIETFLSSTFFKEHTKEIYNALKKESLLIADNMEMLINLYI